MYNAKDRCAKLLHSGDRGYTKAGLGNGVRKLSGAQRNDLSRDVSVKVDVQRKRPLRLTFSHREPAAGTGLSAGPRK